MQLPLAAWVAHVAPRQPSSVGTTGWRIQVPSLPAQLLLRISLIRQVDIDFSANSPGIATSVSQHQLPADIPYVQRKDDLEQALSAIPGTTVCEPVSC